MLPALTPTRKRAVPLLTRTDIFTIPPPRLRTADLRQFAVLPSRLSSLKRLHYELVTKAQNIGHGFGSGCACRREVVRYGH